MLLQKFTLRENCPYSEWMRKNEDQNNSECGHFLRSVTQG